MIYEMKKNESVNSLLKYSGGFTGDAYKKSVRLNRKTGRERAVYNIEEFDFSSFRIDDGDSISVDSILPRYANTVEVKGAVFRPGMYNLGEQINSVRTLVERIDDGDSISVDSILPRYANTVEVKGAVFRPGMYNLGEQINSVRTLVEHAEGLTEEAFTNRAVMHRMKSDRSLEVVSVDIAGIMNGKTPDIPFSK